MYVELVVHGLIFLDFILEIKYGYTHRVTMGLLNVVILVNLVNALTNRQ